MGVPTSPLLAQAAPPSWLPDWLHWFFGLGRWVVDALALSRDRLFDLGLFVVILIVAYMGGRGLSLVLRRTVLRAPRVDDAVARLLGHLAVFGVVLIGFSAGLTLFGTDIAQIATGLGLLTLALGFGMQNTVANLMGGISLAFDKPFRPGDRIEVGEYWGTVQQIGLRSTRILTPRKETVIVPNKIMEEREIWNYTLFSPEFRLDVDVPVAYDADWRLAEKILLEVAREHPNTLHYRPANVLMRKFSDRAVDMQLRCWIADVTVRNETMSDLLKSIKDRFDQSGLEIPLPHISILQKAGNGHRREAPLKPFSRFQTIRRKILVAVSDPHAADERAVALVSLAKALNAGIVAIFVDDKTQDRDEGEISLRAIGEVARGQRIWYKPLVREGEFVATLKLVADEEDVDVVVVGTRHGRFHTPWRRGPDYSERVHRELGRPVVALPPHEPIRADLVESIQHDIDSFRRLQEASSQGDAHPTPPTAP